MRRSPVLLLLCLSACAVASPAQSRVFVVFFPEWSAAIDQPAATVIETAATAAAADPRAHVRVIGFADPKGTAAANALLSRLRAQVVTDQLEHDGLAPSRIRQAAEGSVGYVDTRQESRRVVVSISR